MHISPSDIYSFANSTRRAQMTSSPASLGHTPHRVGPSCSPLMVGRSREA